MTEPYDADDDALLARLRAADPAASMPPAPPSGVDRLLEETMTHDVQHENRETGTRQRSPLTWLVAAAAAVIIAGAGLFVLLNGDDGPSSVPTAGDDPTVTELRAPDSAEYDARCMTPNAEVLSGQATAFDGVVEEISGDLVTLAPTQWYRGTPTDLVTVEAPPEELEQLLTAVEFEDGERYLVAANDGGEVMVCGFSAPWGEDLAAVYAEAFGS